MEKFVTLEAVAAYLPEANVNTDDILPSIWVLNPNTDLGEKLFANRRYDGNGRENPDFVLNQVPYRQARILISGPNFGCGSSREAAVWALSRFGIRCLIAPSYGDIFYENCLQNGVLPIVLDASRANQLVEALALADRNALTVDLVDCSVKAPHLEPIIFGIDEVRRQALLRGQDAVTQLLSLQPDVDAFENRDLEERPWIYGSAMSR
jgi:3-isopropylmalate/(R)-2-methylmalate dehydratase small subunit